MTALDTDSLADRVNAGDARALARVLSLVEDGDERARSVIKDLKPASGARIIGTLVHELRRRGGGIGCAAICSGGGQGDALIVEVNGA